MLAAIIPTGKRITKHLLSPFFQWRSAAPETLLHNGVKEIRIIIPRGQDPCSTPTSDDFLPTAKYHRNGICERPDVLVAEVPNAVIAIRSGMICTKSRYILNDPGKERRVTGYADYGKRRSVFLERLKGTYTTVNYCLAGNFWHWLVDCLPKILTLESAYPNKQITILMPDTTSDWQRISLARVVPQRFPVRYIPSTSRIQVEKFIWASLAGGACSALLPNSYLQKIRDRIGAAVPENKSASSLRLYLSRRTAKHRRVLNEDALAPVLQHFGFTVVQPELLSLDEQISLFRRAEIVMGPHGAGLGGAIFAPFTKLVVLYPTQIPPNYFHSQCIALGHRHYFLCHDRTEEDDDFMVDVPKVFQLLEKTVADSHS